MRIAYVCMYCDYKGVDYLYSEEAIKQLVCFKCKDSHIKKLEPIDTDPFGYEKVKKE